MISRPSIFRNIVLRDLFVCEKKKILVNVVSELDLLFPTAPINHLWELFFFFFKWLDDLLLLVTYSRRYLENPSP